ncbi:MAG: hypothetical protein GYB31_16530 [Bacteroidetes bacterium]|nr:hypothetical protein [Bacteroidota bacterium]
MNLKPFFILLAATLTLAACDKENLPDGIEYTVEFTGTWTSTDHPTDFPDNAHFSTAIGMTHAPGVSFWSVGELASEGVEEMAETGKTGPLESEIEPLVESGQALQLIVGDRLATGTTSVSFTIVVDDDHPEVSLVSMIAPSPDWFVGVDGLSLKENGEWVESLTVNLDNFDSGTDSGTMFKSANTDTDPPENIFQITESPLDYEDKPLAYFKFTRK